VADAGPAGGAAAATTASGIPHSPQNFCPGGLVAPQDEQVAARPLPHSPQNFCPSGFCAPQLVQVVTIRP
jgi:hypothetical protein